MYYFATLFDKNYLSRGIALYNSLVDHSSKDFKLFILALDYEVNFYFKKKCIKDIEIIQIIEIEEFFPELLQAKNNRTTIEYYFTLSPFLPLYILRRYKVDRITTLDADILFFSDPVKIFSYYLNSSVLITPHNFSVNALHWIGLGKYNVSFQSFMNDDRGLTVLEDWRKRCLEWCFDIYDETNKRYADQLYLDKWITDFEGVEEINLPGTGIAPWNVAKFDISVDENKIIFIDGSPLIYYHFQHFRIYNRLLSFHGLPDYDANPDQRGVREIYGQYLKSLKGSWKNIDNNIRRIVLDKSWVRLLSRNDIFINTPFALLSINPYKYYKKIKMWLRL